MTCCQPDCGEPAEFRIEWNAGPDNYTEACEVHVGALLGHRPNEVAPDHYRVYPIANAQKAFEVCLKAAPQQCIRPGGHDGDCDVVAQSEDV